MRDRVAQLRLTLGDAIAERARPLAANPRRREALRADEVECLPRRGPDGERHGVAGLPRDDADGLVDKRAEDLVRGPPGERRDRAAAHRREDLDGALVAQIGVGPEEAHILAVDEHVDEPAERAVAEHALRQLGIPVRDRARERANVGRIEWQRGVAAGGGAERRGETNGDAHRAKESCPRRAASASAYVARNSSRSGAMTGPSAGVATAPLYAFPVMYRTTISSSPKTPRSASARAVATTTPPAGSANTPSVRASSAQPSITSVSLTDAADPPLARITATEPSPSAGVPIASERATVTGSRTGRTSRYPSSTASETGPHPAGCAAWMRQGPSGTSAVARSCATAVAVRVRSAPEPTGTTT